MANQRGRRTRPTSADVAREAGVSRSTVSYVLNQVDSQRIRPRTQARVREAATRLGYTPSAAARTLRTGRSETVLSLLPDLPIGPTLGGFMTALSDGFGEYDLTLVWHPMPHRPAPVADLWRAVAPAAIVSLDPFARRHLPAMRRIGLPVAELVYGTDAMGPHAVPWPNEASGRAQIGHLIAQGHRRLGYAFPADSRLEIFARPRLRGAQQEAHRLGVPEPLVATVPLETGAACAVVKNWLDRPDPVTAVCAYNDEVALAVLAAARSLDVAVPTSLAVIGLDDIPAAALSLPPLTTTRADLRHQAHHLVRVIVDALAGNTTESPTPAVEHVEIVPRQTA